MTWKASGFNTTISFLFFTAYSLRAQRTFVFEQQPTWLKVKCGKAAFKSKYICLNQLLYALLYHNSKHTVTYSARDKNRFNSDIGVRKLTISGECSPAERGLQEAFKQLWCNAYCYIIFSISYRSINFTLRSTHLICQKLVKSTI